MLEEVKGYIKITWNDEDVSLLNMIDRAKSNLDVLIGVELDFTVNEQAKTLFLDYCRYDYNNALEYFEDNFSKEILRLQLMEAVKVVKADVE